MKRIDLLMLLFIGGSMVQEIWLFYGLPRMYYLSLTKDIKKKDDNFWVA